jgi:threonine dehydratase
VEVVLHGESYTDAYNHALTLEKEQKLTFVHPFDDPDVIAGQGTIGMEILRQHRPDPRHLRRHRRRRPDLRRRRLRQGDPSRHQDHRRADLDSDAMARSIKAGERVTLTDVGLFSDGTAVRWWARKPSA